MSDVILFGVLKMPYEMAMANDLSRLQFYQRVQQLVARFEAQPPLPAAPGELLGNPEQLEPRQLPTNCRHCGGSDDVICGGQCRRATDAFADAAKPMQPEQEPDYLMDPSGRCHAPGGKKPLSAGYADNTYIKLWTTPPQPKPLTDDVLVPLQVLEAAENSLGSFCSDLGWSDKDMQNMDNLSAYIAQHKAARGITGGAA